MEYAIRECMHTEGINRIRIATGFWDLLGTALLVEEFESFLKEGNQIEMLIGKDPYVYASQLTKLPANLGKPKYPDDFIRKNIEELDFTEENKRVVRLLNKYCEGEDPAFKIRLYKPEDNKDGKDEGDKEPLFLHSKCYIFTGKKSSGSKWSYAIVGSSNFTRNGLKFPEGNSELNVLEEDHQFINFNDDEDKTKKGHVQWFEEKWAKSQPWNQDFLLKVLAGTPIQKEVEKEEKQKEENLTAPLTPYELYIKLLQYNFGDIVDANTTRKVESYLPSFYKAYQFQTDAVTQCYNIMQRYKGFMLADVVGLGKTVVGTMLIKHFLSVPDIEDRPRKVLIVTPPAIKKGWVDTIADFDKDRTEKIAPQIDLITTGSISNLFESDNEDDWEDSGDFESAVPNEEYGLILIDESHKFRNNGTTMYKELDALIANSTIQPYVGLLSATPQNNRPDDIRNQIYLFSRTHTASEFEGTARNLEGFFADLKVRYKGLKDMLPQERKMELDAISRDLRTHILDKILVRRTRTDVRGYKDEEGNPILRFPKVAAPHKLEYHFSSELTELFRHTMNAIMVDDDAASGLGYYRYRAIQFLNTAEKKDRYRGKGSLDTDRVANQLANIMKMLLVKRLESSFYAFKKSLNKLYDDTCIMLDMLDKQTVFICPADQIDVAKELSDTTKTWEARAEVIRQKIAKLTENGKNSKGSNAEYTAEEFTPDFKEKLIHDRDVLKRLCDLWKDVDDPKRKVFRKQLRNLLPETEPNKKLVIFTESADTLEDIKKVVREEEYPCLCITAANRNKDQQTIQENFDANYKGEHKNDYQVIICTDVLAEGINLHRAYTIINYDTPWNSTKLMQRIGRVNRIGSVADEVHVYNFLPSAEGDSIINLFNRAYTKLQSFHSTFGEDAQVYTDDEVVNHFEVTEHDLEEQESPLMKYLFELREYKQQHPLRYDAIAALDGCIEMAVDSGTNESLFLVQNSKSQGMYIRLESDSDSTLSKEEMFEKVAAIKDANVIDVPADAEEQKEIAGYVFEAEFNKIRLQRSKKVKDEAINILYQITTTYQSLSSDTVKLLRNARRLVDNGNIDICSKIRAIGKGLNLSEPSLGTMMIEATEGYLQKELSNVSQKTQQESGNTEILVALYK